MLDYLICTESTTTLCCRVILLSGIHPLSLVCPNLAIVRHLRATAVPLQRGDECRSTAIRVQQPQLGGTVPAASRKIRRRWMKRD